MHIGLLLFDVLIKFNVSKQNLCTAAVLREKRRRFTWLFCFISSTFLYIFVKSILFEVLIKENVN